MDFIFALRQATRKVLEKHERVWLDEFPVAWSNAYEQSHADLQAAALRAGFRDYVDLLRNCSTFCQFEILPEQGQRPMVRYINPAVKVEILAKDLRTETCERYEHVSVGEIMEEISRRFGVTSFDQLDVPISAVKTLQELTELDATVYNYISAFVGIRHPTVQQQFQPPPHAHDIPEVSLSHVINAVEHLLTPKNPHVQEHAILQYLTREFDRSMPQDLCVRITSPESLVQLVKQIQQEENDAKKQVREMKIHQAVQQAEKIPVTRADLSLAALREMNQADAQASEVQHDPNAAVRTFSTGAPAYVKPGAFLQAKTPKPPSKDWVGLEAVFDHACAQLQEICKHKPNVFSLSLLAKALCTAGKLSHESTKIVRWADFWQNEVLAGLLLRAKAESLYEFDPADRLPQSLKVALSLSATAHLASVLRLQPSEVTWAAAYVHLLDETKAFLQTHKESPVNVFGLGQHLSKLFQPGSSQEAMSPTPVVSPVGSPQNMKDPDPQKTHHPFYYFWTHDALAAYLLASLIRLLGREPAYPDMPEAGLPNATSRQTRSGIRTRSKTLYKADVEADAESAPPHDTRWLLTEASVALYSLGTEVSKYKHQDGTAAMAAVERIALQMQEQKPGVLQFLGEVANLGSLTASFARMTEQPPDSPLEGGNKPSSPSVSPAGRSFRPVASQQMHKAVTDLCKGSSPSQLAKLELDVQQQFKAPSFAALGHGSSLLQLCRQDETVMKTITSRGQSVAPLAQVLAVAQQAVQAAVSDLSDDVQAANMGSVVESCLCAHFRVSSAASLGHGSVSQLISTAQQQPAAVSSVLSAAALAANRSSQSSNSSLYSGGVPAGTAARQALQKAPMLSDLAVWTNWDLMFEQELGQLPDFVQQTGIVKAIQLPSRALLKIPEHASLDDFSSALSQGNAKAVVGSMLSIVADHQGVQHAPLAMLASHCQAHLGVLEGSAEASSLQEGTSTAAGLSKASSFVLACLEQLPHPLLAVLGQPLLLQPLAEVAQSASFAEKSLLKAATLYSQRAVLHALGFLLGITCWQDDWQKMMLPAATHHPPSHPPSAIASLPNDSSSTAAAVSDQASIQALLAQLLSHANSQSAAERSAARVSRQNSRDSRSLMQRNPTSRPSSAPASLAPSAQSAVIDLVGEEDQESSGQQCKAVVSSIRKEEFGVGVVLDAAGSQLRQRQNERIGRALQRLSQELYSKDTHFVLELVQNADDNVYAAGVLPALEFVLQDSGIAVLNNEVGFSEQNIRALCDVGRTTKKHFLGYIGQKGIGFKSVFKVTDAPEIHSNGFHIVFDLVQHSSLGYVLPTWLDNSPAISNSKLAPQATATKMVLPFKQGQQQQFSVLRRRFDDVQPTLLLFLQRLQCIIINDAVNQETSIMVRRPLGGGLVELRHGPQAEHVARYLQVSHTFQPSVPRLDVQLDQTTVSLAFNLEGEVPTQQQVYAFLPLRSYGLSFIVQADFIVPSSREAVDCDSAWNEVLREQVPSLFLQALQSFQQLAASSADMPMAWVNRWLQSIPLPREAQSFFAALPQRLAARLQQAKCIPTEGLQWVYPHEALVCQNPQVRHLLADPRLAAVMTLQYAHSGLTVLHSSNPLQKLLGVGEVAHGHLVDVVRQLHGMGPDKGGMLVQMGTSWLAQLLLCVFNSLAQDHSGVVGYEASSSAVATAAGKAAVAELRQLFPLLLADGSLAALEDDRKEPVYFPMDLPTMPGREGSSGQSALTEKQRELLTLCQLPLRLLDVSFLEAAGPDKQPALIHALETLGVKHLQVTSIITNHMLPALPKCSSNTHVAFLALIINSGLTSSEAPNQELAKTIISSLQSHGKVVTNNGMKQLQDFFMHLSTSLGNKIDLAKLFPKHTWHFPSDSYLATGAGHASAWRSLFLSLGFTDFIQAAPQALLLSPARKADSIWAQADLGPADKNGRFTVQDWSASEFTALVGTLRDQCLHHDDLAAQSSHLLRHLDLLWEEQYAHCCTARVGITENGTASTSATTSPPLPSSFLHALQTSAWLPSTRGSLQQPGSLFMPDRETIALLGDHVSYLKCSIKDPSLIAALGVTTEVTWQDVLRLLTTWAKAKAFRSSLEQMSNLYSFLGAAVESDAEAAEAICAAFRKLPLVWLPSKDASDHSMQSVRSIRSMLSSAVSQAGTPFKLGLVPYEITPTPISALGRKSKRKVGFMTPGTGSHRPGVFGPPHTPHTPSWNPTPNSHQVDGHFYAAGGEKLRLYDSTGVIEGISEDKLGIRILAEHYTSPAVMQFFGQDLVAMQRPTPSPVQQSASTGSQVQSEAALPQPDAAPSVHLQQQQTQQQQTQQQQAQQQQIQQQQTQQQQAQQQQTQQQQQMPSDQQPAKQQQPPQHSAQHSDEPRPQQQQQQTGQPPSQPQPEAAALQASPPALQESSAGRQRQAQGSSGPTVRAKLEEYIDLRSDTDTDMDLSQPSPAKSVAAAANHAAEGHPTSQRAPGIGQIQDSQQQSAAGASASVQSDVDMAGSPAAPSATAAPPSPTSGPPSVPAAAQSATAAAQSPTAAAHSPTAATVSPTAAAPSPAATVPSPTQPDVEGVASPAESAQAPELLIQAEPSCEEYCQALQAVAMPVPPAYYTVQLTKVLAIHNRWSNAIASGDIARQDVQQLKQQLQSIRAFPVAGQQWASLADGIMVNDDHKVASLFEGIKGVVLLSVPADHNRSDRAIALEDLGPLLAALEVPLLSRTVQQSVPQLQGFSGSSQLDPIVADCVLAVQRYLLQRRPEAYHALDETVASRLLNLRCVIVTKLPVTYRLPTAGGVTISQPQRQAAALQDNDLYVEVDRLDSYTHILPELTRLFSDGVKDPDMAQFLITLILTMMSRQDAEDFMQQENCPALPDDVPEWQTPHLARAPEEGDAELSEEGELAMEQDSLLAVRPKREHSPSDPADEPSSKKQRVEGTSSQHYTPLLDPSSRRVDYLDLATPRSALHPSTLKRPRRTAPLDDDGQPAAAPLQRAGSLGSPLQDPSQPRAAPRMLFEPEAKHAQHAAQAGVQQHSAAAVAQAQSRQWYEAFDTRFNNRPKTKAELDAVRQQKRQKTAVSRRGSNQNWAVSSMQDLFDALYPYQNRPWVLQDAGVRAPADWHTIPALAVKPTQHVPREIRDQGRPVLNGKAPQVSPGDVNQQTGRWGEELVFCYLQWQLAAFHPAPGLHCDQAWECRSTGWLVEWINYREETRKPFDIRLRDPQGNEIFVEVKASAVRGRNIFQFSLQELKFAEMQGNSLHVYRVSGMGSANPSLTRLINPVQLSKLKLISLCLQM